MGRYTDYFQTIWQLQSNRKVLGVTLFGVLLDNSKPFTPGNQLTIMEGVPEAIALLAQKGYDFLIIFGQPPSRTRNLDVQDFENILASVKDGIQQAGGRVKNAYYAPGTDKNDPYVKPNPGMFERAKNENNFDWTETFYIGADSNDVKASFKVKANPVLIRSQVNKDLKMKAFELTSNAKIQEFPSLLEFAKSI
jgi:HAD superfamily hydrolase (TIGR01662 family)